MTKSEHRSESWAYAKALDGVAIPLMEQQGIRQDEAYRLAGERLKDLAMPVEQKAQGGLKSGFLNTPES